METLSQEQLRKLASVRDPLCLSLYMPTVRSGREVRQNSIRFGNLLGRAKQQLVGRLLRPRQVESLLKPLARLARDKLFWEQQAEGLTLFRTPRRLLWYRLPERFEELAILGSRLHLKPLVALFSATTRFFLLALSQHKVHLYQGSRHGLAERSMKRVPNSLAEAMRFDQVEKQLQHHSASRGSTGPGRAPVLYHGHGAGKAETKDQVLRYFRSVDRGVRRVLRREHVPLVLVGLGYLLPIYRSVCTYAHLLQEAVDANADELSTQELHARAWRAVEPRFQARRREKRQEYEELSARGMTTDELGQIVPAAAFGRVDTLFLRLGEQRWGWFDERSGRLTFVEASATEASATEAQDLLDVAAVRTLTSGGRVYPMRAEEFPGPAAAILRYEQ